MKVEMFLYCDTRTRQNLKSISNSLISYGKSPIVIPGYLGRLGRYISSICSIQTRLFNYLWNVSIYVASTSYFPHIGFILDCHFLIFSSGICHVHKILTFRLLLELFLFQYLLLSLQE